MINLPSYYKDAKPDDGTREKLPAGPYLCEIRNLKQEVSRNGNDMVVFALDIADGEYKNFFGRRFERGKRTGNNAKWGCVYRVVLSEEQIGKLKHLVNVVAKMNPGVPFRNCDEWNGSEEALKRRFIGVMFRDEEFKGNDGNLYTSPKPYLIDVWDNIKDKPAPSVKRLKSDNGQDAPPQSDYYPQGGNYDDDVPF